jgi:hypothetical protein
MISRTGAPIALVQQDPRKPFGVPVLATLAASIFDAIPQPPSPEDLRSGVYVWSAIVGLVTSGIISCIKEARAAARTRL